MIKKVNKGLILTIIVLLILTTYIVNKEMQRNSEKGKIKEVCEKYLSFEDEYTLLPEKYRNLNTEIPQEELEKYISEMKEELSKISIDDEKIFEIQKDIIKNKIESQLSNDTIIKSKTSKILKVSKYEFEGDQVTVTLEDSIEIEKIYGEDTKTENSKTADTISLKKQDGQWRVIYADVTNVYSYGMESSRLQVVKY